VVDVVAFDFGGVVIHALVPAIAAMAERRGIPVERMLHVLMGDPTVDTDHPWHRAERGELPVAAIQAELGAYATDHGVVLDGDEIDVLMAPPSYGLQEQVLERALDLRARGYRTALVTNSFQEFRPTLESLLDLEGHFDVVIDSSAVGARKPSPEVFEILLRELGDPEPSRVVFLDDFAGNIAGAEAAGLRTIHVVDVAVALFELEELLAGR
jgi:epoxide hydrolase-like predicted phosphatase